MTDDTQIIDVNAPEFANYPKALTALVAKLQRRLIAAIAERDAYKAAIDANNPPQQEFTE